MGVVLHVHPVRGESHIQNNTNRLVATLAAKLGEAFWNDWEWKGPVKCKLRKLRYK